MDTLPVRVIRSSRRKKSSAARVVDGVIEVRIPSWMSAVEERQAVDGLVRRLEKRRAIAENELANKTELARRENELIEKEAENAA